MCQQPVVSLARCSDGMIRANVQVSQFLIRTAEVDKVLNDLRNSVNENRYR